jgi:thymidylate synthase (FAD)
MSVKLKWATPNGDQLIAEMARVSNPANQSNPDSSKLIQYLIKHKHWSPFEMVSACVEIETTRDIGRQILRHRSFSFQEFSQRYANALELPQLEQLRECRLQDEKNRQNSIELGDDKLGLQRWWDNAQTHVAEAALLYYGQALDAGIAKEQARALLPEGLTMSRMYMAGTLRSWMHYIQVRATPETQKEHRIIAEQAAEVLRHSFPETFRAFDHVQR